MTGLFLWAHSRKNLRTKKAAQCAAFFNILTELFVFRIVQGAFRNGYFWFFVTMPEERITASYDQGYCAGKLQIKQKAGGRYPVAGKIIRVFNCMLVHIDFFRTANLQSKFSKSKSLLFLLRMPQRGESAFVQEIITPDHDPVKHAIEVEQPLSRERVPRIFFFGPAPAVIIAVRPENGRHVFRFARNQAFHRRHKVQHMPLRENDPLLAKVQVFVEHDQVVAEVEVQLAGIALRQAAAAHMVHNGRRAATYPVTGPLQPPA